MDPNQTFFVRSQTIFDRKFKTKIWLTKTNKFSNKTKKSFSTKTNKFFGFGQKKVFGFGKKKFLVLVEKNVFGFG